MKFIIYTILISIITLSCSQNKIILTEEQLPEDVFYLENELKPFDGVCEIYYPNSKNIKEEMCFKKGVQDGNHTSYYKNGKIKRTGNYKNGYLNGTWIMYNEQGVRVYEVEYKCDTLYGKYKTWYPTGVPHIVGAYSGNKKAGQWIIYDEAGMITKQEEL